MGVVRFRIGIPRSRVTDTPKQSCSCSIVSGKHLTDRFTERKIGMTDDGADVCTITFGHLGYLAGNKAGFAHRSHRLFRVAIPLRAAFDEDRVGDVMGAAGVGQQLGREIYTAASIPQMVMWINDGLFRVHRWFISQRQPLKSIEFHEIPSLLRPILTQKAGQPPTAHCERFIARHYRSRTSEHWETWLLTDDARREHLEE